MKSSSTKLAKSSLPPVFQSITVKPRANRKPVMESLKPQKRANTFSQSRDTREDRGTRQMKSSQNSQTFSHGK